MRVITVDSSEEWHPESPRQAIDDLLLSREGVITLAPEAPNDHRILLVFNELIEALTVQQTMLGRMTVEAFAEIPASLRPAVLGAIRIIVLIDTIHFAAGQWDLLATRILQALSEIEQEIGRIRRQIREWRKDQKRENSRRKRARQ